MANVIAWPRASKRADKAPSKSPRKAQREAPDLVRIFSVAFIWGVCITAGALSCWYYIDANANPLVMVPLTICAEGVSALWGIHVLKQKENARRIMAGVVLLAAEVINFYGCERAISHYNYKANQAAIEREAVRAPYLEALEAIKNERKTIPVLSAKDMATMPAERTERAQAVIDAQKAALDERAKVPTDELAKLPEIPRVPEYPFWMAFVFIPLKLFGLATIAEKAKNETQSEASKKGWQTRRENQALKNASYKETASQIGKAKAKGK